MEAVVKRHKFFAKPQRTEDGFFASKAELKRWLELKALQAAGEIRALTRQVAFPLWTVNLAGERVPVKLGAREAKYVADFAYHHRDGTYVVEDTKGVDLAIGKLKRAIVLASLGIDVLLNGGQTRAKRRRPGRAVLSDCTAAAGRGGAGDVGGRAPRQRVKNQSAVGAIVEVSWGGVNAHKNRN